MSTVVDISVARVNTVSPVTSELGICSSLVVADPEGGGEGGQKDPDPPLPFPKQNCPAL